MVDLAKAKCWASHTDRGGSGPLTQLEGSLELCFLNDAECRLKEMGYSDAEIVAAVSEHLKCGRIALTPSSDGLEGIIARPGFHDWLSRQNLQTPSIRVNVAQTAAFVDGERVSLSLEIGGSVPRRTRQGRRKLGV